MFKTVNHKTGFPKLEEKILDFWDKNDTFKKSIEERSEKNAFFFYDGPPFATGLPHYGHFIASTIKDVVPRYQTMLGKGLSADLVGTATDYRWNLRWKKNED